MARKNRKLQLVPAPTPNAPQIDGSQEYVSGFGLSYSPYGTALPAIRSTDDCLDDRTYRQMLHDPEVNANVWLLVSGSLADGITLHPKEVPDNEARNQTAIEIAAFLQFCLSENLPKPFVKTVKTIVKNALQYGHKIAEQTWTPIETGKYAGKIGIASIKPKPRNAVSFVVDGFWNVIGFRAAASLQGVANQILPKEKFCWLTLREEDEDPRGNSWLRAVVNPWAFKNHSVWPNYDRFLQRFGTPSLVGTTAENAKDQVLKDATTGAVLTDTNGRPRTLTAQDALLTALLNFKNATAIAIPAGANVTALEVTKEGDAFVMGIENSNREITRGMLFQTRATNEAQHGSRADSQTGAGILEGLLFDLKGEIAAMISGHILKPLIIANYGAENLDLMPFVNLGDSDRKDWATDADAAVKLGPSLTDSQWNQLTGQLGIDPPEEGEELPKRGAASFGQQSGNDPAMNPQNPGKNPLDNPPNPDTNPATPSNPKEQNK